MINVLLFPLFVLSLLITSSSASPNLLSREDLEHRLAVHNLTRRAAVRQPVGSPAPDGGSVTSTNWGGAVINVDISGFWKIVTGTVVLPEPKLPGGTTSTSGATIAIGIDGSTCDTASFQIGIDMTVSPSGSVSYDAWFMWLPGFTQISFNSAGSDITFSPNDPVTFTILTTSSTQGVAIVTNGETGALAVENISTESPLCMNDAEWTVQTISGTVTPLANFGSVKFTNALALTSSDDPGNLPAVSTVILEGTGGSVLTSTSVTDSTITINYVGP